MPDARQHSHHQAVRGRGGGVPAWGFLHHHACGDALPDELQHGGVAEDQEVQGLAVASSRYLIAVVCSSSFIP